MSILTEIAAIEANERCQPVMSEVEQTTLLGFLAGDRGYARDAYTLGLRKFTSWCWRRQHRLFEVRRCSRELPCVAACPPTRPP